MALLWTVVKRFHEGVVVANPQFANRVQLVSDEDGFLSVRDSSGQLEGFELGVTSVVFHDGGLCIHGLEVTEDGSGYDQILDIIPESVLVEVEDIEERPYLSEG